LCRAGLFQLLAEHGQVQELSQLCVGFFVAFEKSIDSLQRVLTPLASPRACCRYSIRTHVHCPPSSPVSQICVHLWLPFLFRKVVLAGLDLVHQIAKEPTANLIDHFDAASLSVPLQKEIDSFQRTLTPLMSREPS
jgi:hypothetical protein